MEVTRSAVLLIDDFSSLISEGVTMIRSTCINYALAAIGAILAAQTAVAQIDESDWNASLTGPQIWQLDDNWSTATFPDDPGRVDSSETVIENVVGANLSVPLASDLTVDVGATDVTVASLRLGGTAGPVTTTVSSSGGRLVFENRELNDETDPDNIIPSFNSSNALIVSGGVPGSTNVISAPVFINDDALKVGSFDGNTMTNDLILSGPISFAGTGPASLNATAFGGPEVRVTGTVVVDDINVANEGANPPDAGFNTANDAAGTIRVTGVVSGAGRLEIGRNSSNGNPLGTVILSGENTISGTVSYGAGNLVLDNDNAFGTAVVRQGNQSGTFGVNLISTDDARVITNRMSMSQFAIIKGEHSLTWAGDIGQTNSRGFINLLPSGKTLTLSGTIAADGEQDADTGPIPGSDKDFYFDGTGKTVVTGALIDNSFGEPINRSFAIRGTGAVYLQGSTQAVPAVSTYSGFTIVRGGNLHFATLADMGQSTEFRARAGAVGLDTGTFTTPTDSATFLSRFNNRSQAPSNPQGDFVSNDDFDTGGLMLAPSEAAANINFTAGALVNVRDMSIAAPEQGISYTGTVTPANSTYRFGGGSGVITLPGTNQLTGANSLVVTNGHDRGDFRGLGGVKVTGSNNYTGVTRVQGKYMTSNTENAVANDGVGSTFYNGTTLTVTNLANGGVASSIGSSSNAASNLVLQGSTLRYEGAGSTTDRLFTIGTHGATLDSSGSGTVQFTNPGALNIATATSRTGTFSGVEFGFQTAVTPASTTVAYRLPNTDDLVIGMEITEDQGFLTESPSDDDEVVTVTAIQSASRIQFSDALGLFTNFAGDPSTVSFIDTERTFELTGDNTGNNTLASVIGDSATNVVNLEKSGAGKWVLTGANTYTGDTSVEDGILSITNAYLADTANVSVDSGALFDLDFSGIDTIDSLFLADASQPLGTYGAFGTGADFESSFFSGTGLLSVTTRELTGILGDYNNDGIVNAADYTVWRDSEGSTATLVNDPLGGTIGAAQYDQWVSNYGSTMPPPAEAFTAAIPEPAAMGLLLIALAGTAVGGRRG